MVRDRVSDAVNAGFDGALGTGYEPNDPANRRDDADGGKHEDDHEEPSGGFSQVNESLFHIGGFATVTAKDLAPI